MKMKSQAILLFILWINLAIMPAFSSNNGYSDCKCIDPWFSGSNSTGCHYPIISGEQTDYCYPSNFGALKCDTWDINLPPYCADSDGNTLDDAESFCGSKWCYVDLNNCRRPSRPSDYFGNYFEINNGNSSTQVGYSYETCGNVNTYEMLSYLEELDGKEIRVSYPDGNSHRMYWENDVPQGSYVDFMDEVFTYLGVETTTVEISNASMAKYPSSTFTACAHEVALNGTDICIASFWISSERRKLTPFTPSTDFSNFYLVRSISESSLTVSEFLAKPFTPFTYDVWLATLALIVFCTLVYTMMEASVNDEDFQTKRPMSSLGHGFYLTFLSLMSGSPVQSPKTVGGKILLLGLAFFILVFTATYTASLASYLVMEESTSTSISSMEEAIAAGETFCIMQSTEEGLTEIYEDMENYETKTTAEDVLNGIDEGNCSLGILTDFVFVFAQYATSDHCDKEMFGDALYGIGVGMPVRKELEEILAWAVVYYSSGGRLSELDEDAEVALYGSVTCDDESSNEDEVEIYTYTLHFTDFGGTFCIIFIFFCVSMVFFFCIDYTSGHKKKTFGIFKDTEWKKEMEEIRHRNKVSDHNECEVCQRNKPSPDEEKIAQAMVDKLVKIGAFEMPTTNKPTKKIKMPHQKKVYHPKSTMESDVSALHR